MSSGGQRSPAQDSAEGAGLVRMLGAPDAAAIMIANMVGVGILVTPGKVGAALGDFRLALAAWALVGAVSLAGALIHAELGCRYPRAGGDYVFLHEAYGPLAAFLSGWTALVVGFPGAIALAVSAAGGSLAAALGLGEAKTTNLLLAVGLLFWISLIHSSGLRWGKRVQTSLVAVELAILLALVAAGWLLDPSGEAPSRANAAARTVEAGIGGAFLAIFFAYSGWNAAAYVAGEIRDPRRNLPRALVGGVVLVTALYLAVNLTYFRLIPLEEMGAEINVGREVAASVFGRQGGRALSLVTALIFLGAASAMTIAGPRIYYAMALDGLFPRALATLGRSSRAPVRALWLQSLWTGVLLLSGTWGQILEWTIFAILPLAALTTSTVFVLRRRERALGRIPPFSAPGLPLTPLVFILAAAGAMGAFAVREPRNALIGSLLVFSGVPAYFIWKRWSRSATS